MIDNYNWLVREYVEDPYQDFQNEKLGVADKCLLGKVVREQADIFTKAEDSLRCSAFIQAVRTEMKRFGYVPRNNLQEFPEALMRTKFSLDGD